MTQRLTMNRLLIFLAFVICFIESYAQFSGGSGDKTDPYQIATANDLITLSEDVCKTKLSYDSRYFILMNDIDFSEYSNDFSPIGYNISSSKQRAFKGNFDGNNKTISNLTINQNPNGGSVGLFGYINGGSVSNLKFSNVKINLTTNTCQKYVGIVAGSIYNTTIDNCSVDNCEINFDGNDVGGICGDASFGNCLIKNCSVTNSVIVGSYRIGGICGSDGTYIVIENFFVENNIITTTQEDNLYISHIGGRSINNQNFRNNPNGDVVLRTQNWNLVGKVGETFSIFNTNSNRNDIAAIEFDYLTTGENGNDWNTNKYLRYKDVMDDYKGYFVYVFNADKDYNPLTNSITVIKPEYSNANEVTIPSLTNYGEQKTYSYGSLTSQNGYWFALGNPFNKKLLVKSIISNISSLQGNGVYIYEPHNKNWRFMDNNKTSYLMPGQGFMVASTANTISGKIINSDTKSSTESSNNNIQIKLFCKTNNTTNSATIKIGENFLNSFDAFDAYALLSTNNENSVIPFMQVDDKCLTLNAINQLPYSCPLYFFALQDNEFEFSVQCSDSSLQVFLINEQDGSNVLLNNESISLQIPTNRQVLEGYSLKISKSNVNINPITQLSEIKAYNIGSNIYIQGENLRKAEVFNILGQRLVCKSLSGNNSHFNSNLYQGSYILKISSSNTTLSQKIVIK